MKPEIDDKVPAGQERFIDLVQIRAEGEFGTGLLVGHGLVLTALHLVRDRGLGWRIRERVGVYLLRELQKNNRHHYAARIVWPQAEEFGENPPDVAVLQIEGHDPPAAQTKHHFGAIPQKSIRGSALGFPKASEGSGLPDKRIERDQPGWIHLTSITRRALTISSTSRPTMESRYAWRGLSGGPLFGNGFVIGVMREVPDGWSGDEIEAEPLAPLLEDVADQSLRNLLGVDLPLARSDVTEQLIAPAKRHADGSSGNFDAALAELERGPLPSKVGRASRTPERTERALQDIRDDILRHDNKVTPYNCQRILSLNHLPNFEESQHLIPTESKPFSWYDHTSDLKDARRGMSGTLLSGLLTNAVYPGFLTTDEILNYSTILLEVSLLFPPAQRRIIKRFCFCQFYLAMSRTSMTANPQLEHHLLHNIAAVGTEMHTWGIRSRQVAFGEFQDIFEVRREQAECALEAARGSDEPLPLWRELPFETVHYELAFRLTTELADPNPMNQALAHNTYREVIDSKASSDYSFKTRINASLNYHSMFKSLDKSFEEIKKWEAKLAESSLSEFSFVPEIMMLNRAAVGDSGDFIAALEKFMRANGTTAFSRLLGYKEMLLPEMRALLNRYAVEVTELQAFRKDLVLPGEAGMPEFRLQGPDWPIE